MLIVWVLVERRAKAERTMRGTNTLKNLNLRRYPSKLPTACSRLSVLKALFWDSFHHLLLWRSGYSKRLIGSNLKVVKNAKTLNFKCIYLNNLLLVFYLGLPQMYANSSKFNKFFSTYNAVSLLVTS